MHRQAITVVLIAVAAVVVATALLMLITGLDLDRLLFEAVSAFGTVGLSTGITPTCPTRRKVILVAAHVPRPARPADPRIGASRCAIAASSTNTRRRGPPLARFAIFGGDTSRRIAEADSVAVIGLGRFGSSLALELMAGGTEVLGIDVDEELVQALNGQLTQVVRADSTKEEALRQLAVHEFDRVVVAIGDDISASILTCSVLLSLKIPVIWAKAVDDRTASSSNSSACTTSSTPRRTWGAGSPTSCAAPRRTTSRSSAATRS